MLGQTWTANGLERRSRGLGREIQWFISQTFRRRSARWPYLWVSSATALSLEELESFEGSQNAVARDIMLPMSRAAAFSEFGVFRGHRSRQQFWVRAP